ncbi:MAG: hypothetical protein K9M12_00290 [Candidatus Pacebacteria bacterium]|nr:hypothetical protein [Candidatus Paceibacterota bacterium]
MKKDFYKKIFYTPLAVFLFLAVISIINQQTVVVGDYFRPAPERLNIIVDEIEQVLYDIAGSETGDDLFSEVTSLMQEADCQYADSLCREEGWTTVGGLMEIRSCGVIDNNGVVGNLWSSESKQEDFYAKQEELQEKKEQLQFLQNILKKEMNHGIAKDIQQMRIQGMDDEADMVEEELGLLLFLLDPNDSETREILDEEIIEEGESILSSSGVSWSTESLVSILDEVVSISPEGAKASCVHVCDQEYTVTFCFNTTKQESVDLVFNIALEISDLVIDPIEIKEIVLALPEEVDIPEVKLQFSIPIPDISTIEGGFSIETEPSPEKGFYSDEIWLSCPEYENHSLSYGEVDIGEINPTEMKWFFETYGYLSDGCNKITSTLYDPIDPLCYDPKTVISRTSSKCASIWGCNPEALTCNCGGADCTLCEDLYCACPDTECSSCTIKNAQAEACASLFLGAGSPIPSACTPSVDKDGMTTWPGDMLPVMKDKCLEILEEEKEKSVDDQDDMPYECALVAAWEGDIDLYSDGYSETIGGGSVNLDEGKIGVLPDSFIGCDPPEIPSFPKIPLSDFNIEIPDIKTPDINFCPIVKVQLPDVIIEDLEFPDIELCNLQECQELLDFFPNFIDGLPTLGRFQIEVPPLDINPIEIDGIGVDIEIAPLENLSLDFHMPQMPNLNSISLSEFIYEIPGIEMPNPELTFSFGGINIDLMSALIGFILNFIMADLPGGCATLGVKIGCLSVVFEDYHLSWGDFPKIPEIPACVTAQEFCRDSKKKLGQLIDTTNEIAEGIQSTVGGVLQIPSDKIDEIEALINEKVQEKEEEINDMVEDYDLVGEIGEELIELIDIGDIEIDISLTDIAGIPETVTIPWDALGVEPKITLSNPIEIEMPTIPLSDIGVEKELIIYIPFLQVKELFSADIGGSSCESDTSSQSLFQDFFDNNFDTKLELQVEDIINIIED